MNNSKVGTDEEVAVVAHTTVTGVVLDLIGARHTYNNSIDKFHYWVRLTIDYIVMTND